MDAIDTLMTEHRLIERAIDALVAFAAAESRKTTSDRAELGRFVTFIREFADGIHHGKEEDILFAAMVDAGFPRQAGPVGVMLAEHDEGRKLVGYLRGLAEQETEWTIEDRQLLVDAANGYAELLRAHIHKEDAILYPMAEQRLAPESLELVNARCADHDQRKAASAADLQELGEALVENHAPQSPRRHVERVTAFVGCH